MTEEERIKTAVESVGLPAYVREIKYEFDLDSGGEPGVWIYVIVDNKEGKSPLFMKHAGDLEQKMFDAIMETGKSTWPYFRLRTVSEQRQLDREDAA